jgi:hypothetical protein
LSAHISSSFFFHVRLWLLNYILILFTIAQGFCWCLSKMPGFSSAMSWPRLLKIQSARRVTESWMSNRIWRWAIADSWIPWHFFWRPTPEDIPWPCDAVFPQCHKHWLARASLWRAIVWWILRRIVIYGRDVSLSFSRLALRKPQFVSHLKWRGCNYGTHRV